MLAPPVAQAPHSVCPLVYHEFGGLILGTLLGGLQVLVLPWIQKATPMEDVRAAARAPAILASILQVINGLVFIGEGVMSGCGDFMFLAMSTIVATVGCVAALNVFPQEHGVLGVWMGFAVVSILDTVCACCCYLILAHFVVSPIYCIVFLQFNLLRLSGVAIHQFYTSPIAPRKLQASKKK